MKLNAGFEEVLPNATVVAFTGARFNDEAPPVSRFSALTPLLWMESAPEDVGVMVDPIVMLAPVTVKVLLVVPPAAVKPSV